MPRSKKEVKHKIGFANQPLYRKCALIKCNFKFSYQKARFDVPNLLEFDHGQIEILLKYNLIPEDYSTNYRICTACTESLTQSS